jgi:hypothetical protein
MDNVFRTKKYRDMPLRAKTHPLITGTLDSIHQSIVSSLKDADSIGLEARCLEIRERVSELRTSARLEDILDVSKLLAELDACESVLRETNAIESYYLKNADIMMKYYGTQEKAQIASIPGNNNTFMKYLNASLPSESAVSKKELFDTYASRMKLNTVQPTELDRTDSVEHCLSCNVAREELSSEGILICPLCGSEEHMLVVSDFPSFRDPPKDRNNYAYKKINHLNEILNQFQAKESTIIPDEVMHEVVCEIKKRRIQNIAELTEKDMREILKKLNRSKFYEHATHILSRLNGNPPPTITPEIEEKVRAMFQEIQAPFLMYCPDDRTNFLSYSYILYKFFELLELDDYKVYFPLLKSRDRLIAHDEIWKKICDYLKWEFIQSV